MQASWAKDLASVWSAEHVGHRSRQNRGQPHGKFRTFDLSPIVEKLESWTPLNIWSFINFQRGSKHVRLMFGHLTFHQFSQRLEAGFELSAMTSWKSMTFVMVRSTGTSNYSSKFHEPRCWCPLECREPSATAHDRIEECFARSPDLSTIVEKLWTHEHAVHLTFQQFYRS